MSTFEQITLHGKFGDYGAAMVRGIDGLVGVHITTTCTMFSATVEIHPHVARKLAALLVQAAAAAEEVQS